MGVGLGGWVVVTEPSEHEPTMPSGDQPAGQIEGRSAQAGSHDTDAPIDHPADGQDHRFAEDTRPVPRRVFVSHTSELRALPAERSFVNAVEDAITRAGDVVVDMKYWTAVDCPPAHEDRERLSSVDVYVLLAGFCYGSLVRDQPEVSYTELEFLTATELGIPRLVFLLSEHTQGPAALFADYQYGARQAGFRQRLQDTGVVTALVDSPDRAETLVFDALTRLPRLRPRLDTPAFVESADTCTWTVDAGAGPHLWLRSGPGTWHRVVSGLAHGQRALGYRVGVESGDTTWYLLRRNDHGWAWGNGKYLKPVDG
jgi:hypothetical protein